MQDSLITKFLIRHPTVQSHYKRMEITEVPSNQPSLNETTVPMEELLLVPIWFVVIAWGVVLLMQFHFWKSLQHGITNIKCGHKIPCANCKFFNNNPYLKCAIRPSEALSEEAINCSDYMAKDGK